eukprot:TRINITY_DN15065_c0_g4_i1.p1 TRINITY_DN15065_c0_g4~~TRINITY_DN15065_c0_g4_i1.p1  ORF type:complete len:388 (-),score=77.46 TRINITY_DN15065_c0_g4_i1:211-1314(-)
MAHPGCLGNSRFILPFQDPTEDIDWFSSPPRSHSLSFSSNLGSKEHHHEVQRSGRQLVRQKSFKAPCARDELTISVTLETPHEAKKLWSEMEKLSSSMHGMQMLLLEQFIEEDHGDDLLLLTATEVGSGRLLGFIFWRYLQRHDDSYWEHILFDWEKVSCEQRIRNRRLLRKELSDGRLEAKLSAVSDRRYSGASDADLERILPTSSASDSQCPATVPPPDSWLLVELLCTEEAYRGHGIGKLLLVAALAYSAVKDGKTAAVLTVGHGDDNLAAGELYRRLGFQRMPPDFFQGEQEDGQKVVRHVDPRHVLVLWDIKRSLGKLTLEDVSGSNKGTHVLQLESGELHNLGTALDSQGCTEFVDQITGQ